MHGSGINDVYIKSQFHNISFALRLPDKRLTLSSKNYIIL